MDNESPTDSDLLAAIVHGDDGAFTTLVRRYVRAGTLLAAQLLGDVDDAEDIVQDAFTVVYRRARTFDSGRPFGPWFFGIVRRLASNRRTRDRRRKWLLARWWPMSNTESSAADAERSVAASSDADAARRAMRELSTMQRACFELVVVRGLSIDDVANMHGISESTVRQHVFRARAALRNALGEASPAQQSKGRSNRS